MQPNQFPDNPPATDDDDLIDEQESARDLHVKESTLASWRSTGKGPDFYRFGRIVRYSRRLNAEWKAQQRRSPRQIETSKPSRATGDRPA